jgi:hypothetical protein
MHIMLPCPMHEPAAVAGRRGHPFRYWNVPFRTDQEALSAMRSRYLRETDELLIFYSVSNWAWRAAEAAGLTFYRYLAPILDHHLREIPRPVTVLSVNNGSLLQPPPGAAARFVNLPPVPTAEFEALLFGSDLFLTENSISISIGKAICGLQPCAGLMNSFRFLELMDRLDGPLKGLVLAMENGKPGTVFPFKVYPTGMTVELDRLILYSDNCVTDAFRSIEIFGNGDTGGGLKGLLIDEAERESLRNSQWEYVRRLQALADPVDVLDELAQDGHA